MNKTEEFMLKKQEKFREALRTQARMRWYNEKANCIDMFFD